MALAYCACLRAAMRAAFAERERGLRGFFSDDPGCCCPVSAVAEGSYAGGGDGRGGGATVGFGRRREGRSDESERKDLSARLGPALAGAGGKEGACFEGEGGHGKEGVPPEGRAAESAALGDGRWICTNCA
jgi:hypothetical protein